MLSEQYKYCWAGVSWNVDRDCVLLQLTKEMPNDECNQIRVRLTPAEALELAKKLESTVKVLNDLTNGGGLV
jgi:hypothetical protein